MACIKISLLISVLLATIISFSSANPARSHNPVKRQSPPLVVTGAQDGSIQPRLEIRDLQANADQLNIFLLGLQDLKNVDQADLTSYFQVAGMRSFSWSQTYAYPNQVFMGGQKPIGITSREIHHLRAQDIAPTYPIFS
jgi:hypothetical protein